MSAPAGWYADAGRPGGRRYWDGAAWTEHVAEGVARTERLATAVVFDPDHRPAHAAPPARGPWAWLAPLLVLIGAGATLLALWLTGSLVWAPAPILPG